MEGISSNAAKLISQSGRPGSIASYKPAMNKWTSWCVREKIDPFYAPLSKIANYLSTLFEEGLQYQTVNAHQSVISANYSFINGELIDFDPSVSILSDFCLNLKNYFLLLTRGLFFNFLHLVIITRLF